MKYCVFPRYIKGKLFSWYRFPVEHPGRYADRPIEVYIVGAPHGWYPSSLTSVRNITKLVHNGKLDFHTGRPLYNVEFKHENH